jgi:hypothetical protein
MRLGISRLLLPVLFGQAAIAAGEALLSLATEEQRVPRDGSRDQIRSVAKRR